LANGKTRFLLSVMAVVFILTGCSSKEKNAEELYQVLESVVNAEKGFEEQQEHLVKLEKQEKDIYNQIMAIGMKQHEEIVKLSDQALVLIEKRRVHIQKEIESINASRTEFIKAEEIKNKMKDPKLKSSAEDLFDIMSNRYNVHEKLSQEYSNALDRDKELYIMLKNESISYEKLETHITELNNTYQKVFAANEEFNDLTASYNEKKLQFYQAAGLNIEDEG
jgi:uncharacterized protein YcfL